MANPITSKRSQSQSKKSGEFAVDQIDHVELFVPDRHEAALWYRRVLGLSVLRDYLRWAEDPEGPLMISSDGGSTKLALFAGTPQGTRESAGLHRVAFRVDAENFKRFLDRLAELDLSDHLGRRVTPNLVVDHGEARSLYFCDPYGNLLELTNYGDAAK